MSPPPDSAPRPPPTEREQEYQRRLEALRRRVESTQEYARKVVGTMRDQRMVQQQGGSALAGAPTTDVGTSESSGAAPVVLVVDDEPLVRAMLARCLALGGYRVLQASGGEEALALLAITSDVAVMVTDTWMPGGISGVELIRRVRAARPSLGILRISGLHESHFYHDPPPADVPFLAKPFPTDELLRSVAALVPLVPPS